MTQVEQRRRPSPEWGAPVECSRTLGCDRRSSPSRRCSVSPDLANDQGGAVELTNARHRSDGPLSEQPELLAGRNGNDPRDILIVGAGVLVDKWSLQRDLTGELRDMQVVDTAGGGRRPGKQSLPSIARRPRTAGTRSISRPRRRRSSTPLPTVAFVTTGRVPNWVPRCQASSMPRRGPSTAPLASTYCSANWAATRTAFGWGPNYPNPGDAA